MSILGPLGIDEPRSHIDEDEEIDQEHLIRAIMALTETDTPVHSPKRPAASDQDLESMRAEAEKDFQEWKKTKRLLRRNTSSASTVGSPMPAYDFSHH